MWPIKTLKFCMENNIIKLKNKTSMGKNNLQHIWQLTANILNM